MEEFRYCIKPKIEKGAQFEFTRTSSREELIETYGLVGAPDPLWAYIPAAGYAHINCAQEIMPDARYLARLIESPVGLVCQICGQQLVLGAPHWEIRCRSWHVFFLGGTRRLATLIRVEGKYWVMEYGSESNTLREVGNLSNELFSAQLNSSTLQWGEVIKISAIQDPVPQHFAEVVNAAQSR